MQVRAKRAIRYLLGAAAEILIPAGRRANAAECNKGKVLLLKRIKGFSWIILR